MCQSIKIIIKGEIITSKVTAVGGQIMLYNKTGNVRIMLTMRRVHATIVAVENKYAINNVSVVF
jgi:L-lactate utilization protein LutB